MKSIRELRQEEEGQFLSSFAIKSSGSAGRMVYEDPCDIRTCFQRDIDRIVHSKAFRRLKHKTQVFLQPEGDHYRTRMTHTIEVVRISRTLARALRLNEDLTEAIAWGHDLGHTPFGHAGERALAKLCPEGFRHNEQSLRVVDLLEKNGIGLNLCMEVRDGILNHTGEQEPSTLEGKVVKIADRVAYICHDLDDAIRAGILSQKDIPPEIITATGAEYSKRLDVIIHDIIQASFGKNDITLSPQMYFVMESFRNFMYERVYYNPIAKGEEKKVFGILEMLYNFYLKNHDKLPRDYISLLQTESLHQVVCDYIAGMTDKYAMYKYNELFIPESWQVR
ncbi:MAG: deoxyguanosinetriphosphate triphosphohydrolase [Clostridiales bacterium]|jgi:dGTPase|nr:deoxyguanosinetriphosphate triphosphohydrolase [Clostridiales bacterium]